MKWLFKCSLPAVIAAALVVGNGGHSLAQMPGMASPLAGGHAAATGGAFMDVHGKQIVMPANYAEPCAGYGEMCPPGCDDGSYADFGGYSSPDQCGPHYFDVALFGVALTPDNLFQDVPALASIGIQGPRILDPDQEFDEYEPGWQIAMRLDLGPLSVVEATYMGVYDIGFEQTINSVDVAPLGADFQLNSVFSDFGLFPIDGLDEGSVYNLQYQSELQSTELSYRRYWVGYNPRVSGTYLLGARYVRLTEDLQFNATALNGDTRLRFGADNDVVGLQAGADAWVTLRQGLRVGGESKAGVYNNRFEYFRTNRLPGNDFDLDLEHDGNQVAFVGESSIDVVADILPSFSIRGGYRVLYLSSLVTVGNNVFANNLTPDEVLTQADALYHGFYGGLEYVW